MGLLDILNGMQNGPRGAANPGSGASSGHMSPIMMAMLGLLACKALKGIGGQPGAAPANSGATPGGGLGGALGGMLGGGQGGALGGGLGGLLQGGLGGLLAGGGAGSVLSGGLNDVLRQFQQSGHEDTANSWVGDGPNQPISPNDLGKALGADQINMMMQHSGLSRNELLDGLSQHLPELIDQLTPNGRLPSEQELSRLI